jgi:hypothetical protein
MSNLSGAILMRQDFNFAEEISSRLVMSLNEFCEHMNQRSHGQFSFHELNMVRSFFQMEDQLAKTLQQCKVEMARNQQLRRNFQQPPHEQSPSSGNFAAG